jgi:hypothetical protein
MILNSSYEELTKYIDVPATSVGDLFYIQNLTLAILILNHDHLLTVANVATMIAAKFHRLVLIDVIQLAINNVPLGIRVFNRSKRSELPL